MQSGSWKKLAGTVEADETFVGGKVANMHLDKKTRMRMNKKRVGGFEGKTIVMGLLERDGEVRAHVIGEADTDTLHKAVKRNVRRGSEVFSDGWKAYNGLDENSRYIHNVINHAEKYVDGNVHTNHIESFWSLLKRGIIGTYHNVSRKYLPLYLAEFQFRFNNRNNEDIFGEAIGGC